MGSDVLTISNPIYASPVFLANIQATEPIIGNQGGTWSGKTFSIIQVLLFLTVTTEYKDESGRLEKIITTIVGQDVPNLKKGAITDFQNIIEYVIESFPKEARYLFKHTYNKTDKVCIFTNGSKIEFSSFKDWQDAKSGKRHFLFINEANGVPYKVFEQLQFRTKIRTFLDYNPDAPFWVHLHLIGKQGVKMIYSNLTHNKFIPDQVKRELIAKGKINPEFKKVYLLGKTGATAGVIYKNVTWVQQMPKNYKKESFGMDFGFTNDPTTLVRIVESEGRLFGELLLYEHGLVSAMIVERFKAIGMSKNKYIFADSEAPMTIQEIRLLGYTKVMGARKGQGSIKSGIDLVLNYGAMSLVDNPYWREEQIGYIWQEDKATGSLLNEPRKKFNHIWDAFRYAMQGIANKREETTYS